jgi:CRP/FNR family transcriptional regulator, cyclic AMP receptor protein
MQSTELLHSAALFSGASGAAVSRLARSMLPQIWPRHTQIMAASQTSQRFVVLTAGRVRINRSEGDDGRELTLWLLGPGDGFDVVALLDGEPHAVSAVSVDEVHGFSIPLAQLREHMEADVSLRLALHRYAAAQLRELSDLAADLAIHHTATRLARLLLRYLGQRGGVASLGPSLIDGLSNDELAAMIGSVRVVVNRLLGQLRRASIVRSEHGRLRVLDLQRLAAQADMLEQAMPGTAVS